jgi:WD40 repeat protein
VEASVARAEREALRSRAAQVRQLAAQGQVILAFDPPEVGERGLLLAIEAMQTARALPQARLEADQALRQGLALLARRVRSADAGSAVAAHAWAVHPNRPFVAAGCNDGRIRIWALQQPGFEDLARLDSAIGALRFSSDGRWMAAGAEGQALLWDVQAQTMHSLPTAIAVQPDDTLGAATAIAFSRSGDRLAIALNGRSLVWQLADPAQPPLALPSNASAIVDLDFSADAAVLIEQPLGAPAACWRLSDSQRIGSIGDGGNQVLHSPDGRFVGATGPFSYKTTLWDVYLREARELANNGAKIAFSADGRHLAMASPEHFAQMWRLPDLSLAHRWSHHAETWDLDFSPDGRRLATASKNGVVHVWDVESGAEVARLIDAVGQPQVRFAGDSSSVVTRDDAGRFAVWHSTDLRHERTLRFKLATLQVAFDPRGRLLAVGVREGQGVIAPALIDLGENQLVGELRPDGAEPVQGVDHARALLEAHKAGTGVQARSARGRWQTLGTDRRVISVVDGQLDAAAAAQAAAQATLRHDHDVRHCIFSPDETHLATVSDADHVRIWDLAHGVEVSRLTLPTPNIAAAAFSPNGRMIATAGWDGAVRLWWWWPDDLLAEARSRVQRELTAGERARHMPTELMPAP